MPQMKVQLLKGDRVDTGIPSRVDYRDALPQNVTGILRPVFDVNGYMLQQPGMAEFGTGQGNDRGAVWNEKLETHFRVSGDRLISVSNSGVVTDLGYVPGIDQVSLPYSFNTQAIIANGGYYLYDPVNGFRKVLDVDLGVPIDAIWVDGYYFFTDGDALYHTDITDESSIDPLQFATSEFSPDKTLGVGKTNDNKVIAFNRYSIEYFANDASDNFSFVRLPGRSIKYGLVATHLKCEIGGTWYFVGGPKEGSLSVYQLAVGQPTEIASREVTQRLEVYNENDLSQSVLESRILDGYPCLILHMPNETLFYNIKVGATAGPDQGWSKLASPGSDGWSWIHGIYDPTIGKWIYGGKNTNRISQLDVTLGTEYGDLPECYLYTPFMYLDSASIDKLDIETIPGFNANDDASVFLSLTYDGAIHSQETIVPYSKPGAYDARFIVRRLGYVDNYFAFRMRWKSTSRMCFSRAVIDYD